MKGLNGKWWNEYKEAIGKAMMHRNHIFDEYETNAIRNIFTLQNDAASLGLPWNPTRKQWNFIKDMAEKAGR